jgi:hypothetical protein
MTFDQPSYAKGAPIKLTVNYVRGYSDQSNETTYVAKDETTGQTGQLTVSFVVANATADPTSGAVTDSGNRAWTLSSDSGSVAVFTATA